MPTKGTMLPGFAKGVTGMGVGERRLIHIPWKLGYGKKGRATIWGLEPQWCDDQMEDNFSGFRGICKHTVFKISLIRWFRWFGFVLFLLGCQRLKPSDAEVVLSGKKPKIPPMSDLDFDASLTFCGVDWKERSNRSDAGLKVRVFIVESLHGFDMFRLGKLMQASQCLLANKRLHSFCCSHILL